MKLFKLASDTAINTYFTNIITDYDDNDYQNYLDSVIRNDMFKYNFKYFPYISKLLYKLLHERMHASITGYTLETAAMNFNSIILSSADKYGRIISLYETTLDDMLDLDRITTKVSESDLDGTTTDDAAEDTALNKFNDTPNAGNNPDLLTDTYLSSSDRNKFNIGERNRAIAELRTQTEELNDSDNIAKLEAVGRLQSNIANIFDEWLDYVDKKALTYDFYL